MANEIHHRCAVLGKPISHSLSPLLHNAAYRALGLDDWYYKRAEVGESDLDGFLEGLDSTWVGLSLTMPLKRTIQPYGTPSDDWSRKLLVANTAIFDWSGTSEKPNIRLYNTDVEGIEKAFSHAWQIFDNAAPVPTRETGNALDLQVLPNGANAVILGNGNTALSALAACTGINVPGKGPIAQVTVCARHQHENDPMKQLAQSESGFTYQQVSLSESAKYLLEADIVINTIPSHGADDVAAQLEGISIGSSPVLSRKTLLDVVYDPRPTNLMQSWRANGGTAIGGEEMLLYQAIAQVRLMTVGAHIIGTADFEQAMRSALQEAL
ncbi:shikimate dehydrogenase [Bifidobacterium sp. ESL0798]|uniref:shikimate dehydrogenase family protein n=1 Tax=Bifidobacterium sp. ESL0798 TaxID=2983235 RepID=UPI0023F704D6|nr:shikimate dehydrogenase [Bifidobacterium sp. ESL0798]WEV74870.1 shikimate dehydrogenase [Bifidobacterium sp. ESL0798]